MEVFVRNLPCDIDSSHFIDEIAKVLHGRAYGRNADETPINFEATLHRPNRHRGFGISFRTGTVTFPDSKIGEDFLSDFGGDRPKNVVKFGDHPKPVLFNQSKFPPKLKLLEIIRRIPYRTAEQRRHLRIDQGVSMERETNLKGIQFGWECRDNVFSVEWESLSSSPSLVLDDATNQITIFLPQEKVVNTIIILFSQICAISMNDSPEEHVILLNLSYPVQYRAVSKYVFQLSLLYDTPLVWHRKSVLLDEAQARVSPFTSTSIRLIFSSARHLHVFRQNWMDAMNWRIESFDYGLERRNLFSPEALGSMAAWVEQLGWPLAFHVDALVANYGLDPKELLSLQPDIQRLVAMKGLDFTSRFIRCFKDELLYRWYSELTQSHESAKEIFERLLPEHKTFEAKTVGPAEDLFECLHVIVTPTRMVLEGPCVEGTNRIVRSYPAHTDAFLRVSFEDENKTKFRFDRQVNGQGFINERVGKILREGLVVGGRRFEFLAYSQSALKEHAVWFMSRFWDENKLCWVDAKSIIEGIGSFSPELVRCPARYAARISQAFTTTDASVEVDAEEVIYGSDIEQGKVIFTDGIGTISLPLAEEIWRSLKAKKRRGYHGNRPLSKAFQIRFQGSKGMVSVDYKLSGRVFVLRPSMIKFESITTTTIEIAGVFSKPGKMFLNRPLIMLLEGLGVSADTFMALQRDAVKRIRQAHTSMTAARLLIENYGLGSSFRLSSTLLHLGKLKCTPSDEFYKSFVRLCVLHALREVKYKARIPVPGWTLVGIADVHSYLKEGQVFVCIEQQDGKPTYLSGPVSISRSPTIHPGDVQMAHAIGSPPPDSPFAHERLPNTIVFSTMGTRPLPSMLGGGDLDGDVYNVTDYTALHPKSTCTAAEYDAARRKLLDRPSTIDDVIDFVVDFMNSDNVGIIATNWLVIADERGIHDPDCIKLAKLHSDAVDFPKSGLPVPMQDVPSPDGRLGTLRRPDWNEPETGFSGRVKVYESAKAIGLLFRDIDLPRIYKRKGGQQRPVQSNRRGDDSESDIDSDIDSPLRNDVNDSNVAKERNTPLHRALLGRVSELVYSTRISSKQQSHLESVFFVFTQRLKQICYTHSLSWYRSLTEEEALVGTIKARTSNPRRRRDTIAKLREQTGYLVADIIFEITGDDEPTQRRLKVALAAWELAQSKNEQFGAKSFAWIALVALFDAIKAAEDDDRDMWAGIRAVYPQ